MDETPSPSPRRPSLSPGTKLMGRPVSRGCGGFEEQFVHGHAAVLLDAAEVLHGASRRLAEEGEGHDQLAGPPGVLRVVGALVLLKGPVEDVLQPLDRLRVLDLHGVCREGEIEEFRMALLRSSSPASLDCSSSIT
ncbi:hypothetical protein EYF80_028209 [Liparis tanakae]|uniref:Uncharacterized protein n=1 Tax=Liparis tanakae TaxID=230148 RepID=A0A4Z2H6Q5_9TELE|nr:hypothetical protein EYF80_028209 [Liparis tanakae]